MTTLPPTRKLFWADPYRRQFTARVLARRPGPQPSLALNRTLFYPTGGGQPHDRGRLGGAQVLAVESEQAIVYHYVDQMPEGDELSGEIAWPRRYDHMQQHSGQHLLSAACVALLDRPTIGFHLSPDSVTIDLPGPPPTPADLDAVLDFCQAVIGENRPITSAIYPAEAAASLPLRKPPAVAGPVRVVEIADLDWSACGGTHIAATAAIGSLIVTRVERRGGEARLHFACGDRAAADHRRRLAITQTLAERLTTGLDDLPAAISRVQEEATRARTALRQAEALLLEQEAARLLAAAPVIAGQRFVRSQIEGDDPAALNRLLGALTTAGDCVAALGWAGPDGTGPRWAAARSADLALDLRQALPAVQAIAGARGGGKPDLIQGGAPDLPALKAVLDALQAHLSLV